MSRLAEDEFGKAMKELSDFYGKKSFSPDAMELWYEKLKWLQPVDFHAAIDEITTKERTFPTPQVVFKYADEVSKRRAERDNAKDREQAKKFFEPESHNSGLARDATAFNVALMGMPKGTVEKFGFEVSGLKALMKKYPNIGFENNYQDAVKRLNAALEKEGKTNVMPMETEKEERETK